MEHPLFDAHECKNKLRAMLQVVEAGEMLKVAEGTDKRALVGGDVSGVRR